LYGGFKNIDGGYVSDALQDLTNGTGSAYDFNEEECRKMIDSG
jgi:hypothetical protein